MAKDFAPTIVRLSVGGLALYKAARLMGILSSQSFSESMQAFSTHLAEHRLPAPDILGYVILGLLVLGGLSVVLGFKTRLGAVVLAIVFAIGLLSGPTIDQLDGVEQVSRVTSQLHFLGLACSIAVALQGPGMLATKA